MIAAISFVSVEDVIQAFEELFLHSGDVEQEVLDYFETNYIELRRGRRLAPRLPHEVWNMKCYFRRRSKSEVRKLLSCHINMISSRYDRI